MKNASKIIIGTFCMAAATNTVFQPLGIVTGGFSGLGIILFRMLGIPLWVVNTVLNVPFFCSSISPEKSRVFLEYFIGSSSIVDFSWDTSPISIFSEGFLCQFNSRKSFHGAWAGNDSSKW